MLEFTDTGVALTGAATVTCPAISKIYICKNDSGQQVTITTAAGTGVDIPDGATMLVFCDGTNVVQGTTNVNSLTYQGYTVTFGGNFTTANSFTTAGDFALTLTATGATNVTLPTTGTLATLDGTETFTNKTFTSPTITSPTMTGSISATDLDISGDTTIGDAAADTLTITATVTSNITFTDDTYDIGADGATRPRSLYLSQDLVVGDAAAISGNATVGGTLGVTGNVAVNTDKVTIEATTGNTAIAGTLGVTGNITASAALVTDTISEKTATAGVTVDGVVLKDGGVTVTADINFGDNDKAIFGASSDLQIYHDGSNSYIDEVGTGTLRIRGYNQVRLTDTSDNIAAIFKGDAESTLYHNNSTKLATTSTGVDVTGNITADSADITGTVTADGLTSTGNILVNGGDNRVDLYNGSGQYSLSRASTSVKLSSGGNIAFDAGSARRAFISSVGDISFYEDTGTTPKLTWKAADESLELGTSSGMTPTASLVINEDVGGTPAIEIVPTSDDSNNTTAAIRLWGTKFGTANRYSEIRNVTDGATAYNELAFDTNGSERMRIDSSGNVGIGTDSPSSKLHVAVDGETTVKFGQDAGGDSTKVTIGKGFDTASSIEFARSAGTDATIEVDSSENLNLAYNISTANASFRIKNGVSNAVVVDSSGNMLVGTTSTSIASDTSGTGFLVEPASAPLQVKRETESAGQSVVVFNNTGVDGQIIDLRKDGAPVGSIGTSNGDIQFADGNDLVRLKAGKVELRTSGDMGGIFVDDTNNAMWGGVDATVDLGRSAYRYKDLYLSGTVNIANWDITDDGSGNLMFSVSGVNKMRLNADGSLDVAGDINANATL
jgi:hypothetical protein